MMAFQLFLTKSHLPVHAMYPANHFNIVKVKLIYDHYIIFKSSLTFCLLYSIYLFMVYSRRSEVSKSMMIGESL